MIWWHSGTSLVVTASCCVCEPIRPPCVTHQCESQSAFMDHGCHDPPLSIPSPPWSQSTSSSSSSQSLQTRRHLLALHSDWANCRILWSLSLGVLFVFCIFDNYVFEALHLFGLGQGLVEKILKTAAHVTEINCQMHWRPDLLRSQIKGYKPCPHAHRMRVSLKGVRDGEREVKKRSARVAHLVRNDSWVRLMPYCDPTICSSVTATICAQSCAD